MNEDITEETVLLCGDDGKLAEVPLVEALRIAKSRKLDLVEEWERPSARPGSAVVCQLLHIRHPVAWEGGIDNRTEVEPTPDPALWFHTDHCSGSHYFLGNPHTFTISTTSPSTADPRWSYSRLKSAPTMWANTR